MLRDLDRLLSSNAHIQEENLTRAANLLLTQQFLWREGHGSRVHYNMVVNHRDYFTNLFEALNFDLIINHDHAYCGIIPRQHTPGMTKVETLILLLLARLYDGELRRANSEDGRVRISGGVLIDQYQELTSGAKPEKGKIQQALSKLHRHRLITVEGIDPSCDLPYITVLPSIIEVVTPSFMEALTTFAGDNTPDNEDEVLEDNDADSVFED